MTIFATIGVVVFSVSLGFLLGLVWSNMRFSKSDEELLTDFKADIWNQSKLLDPNNTKDWNDLACGYFLGKGISLEQATNYQLLCAANAGHTILIPKGSDALV